MTNLIIIGLIFTGIFIILKFVALYLLIKISNNAVSIFPIIKFFLIYELEVVVIYLIKPKGISSLLAGYLTILIFVILSFVIFSFLARHYSLLNFKKSIIIFLIMFILLTPLLLYCKNQIGHQILESQLKNMDKSQLYAQLPVAILKPTMLSRVGAILDNSVLESGIIRDLSITLFLQRS